MNEEFAKLFLRAMSQPKPDYWNWKPAQKGTCLCGHSWMFHWLKPPHKCNECKNCPGYEAKVEAL